MWMGKCTCRSSVGVALVVMGLFNAGWDAGWTVVAHDSNRAMQSTCANTHTCILDQAALLPGPVPHSTTRLLTTHNTHLCPTSSFSTICRST